MNKNLIIIELFKENIDFEFDKFHTVLGKNFLLVTVNFKGGKVILDLFNGFADPHQTRQVENILINSVAKPSLKKNRGLLIKLEMNDYFLTTRIIKGLAFEKYKETTEYKMKNLYGEEFKIMIEEMERKIG